jgi:hypothetical protein
MHSEILKPVVVLVAWTLVMLVWLVVTRVPALKKAGIDLNTVTGGRPGALDTVLPEQTQWKAHNYIHLVEQPTLFYAICIVIALTGTGNGPNAWIAWAYVALRIAHSLVQVTTNRVRYRFALFGLSTLALIALTLHAAMAVFH